MTQKENQSEKCFSSLNDISELERIRTFVSDCAKKFGFSDDISYKISLAVDEACTNLIKYTFNSSKNKDIKIKITCKNNDLLEIYIYDKSEPFNPLLINSPDMNEYLKSYKKGGLGIYIMKLIMDDIEYIPRSQNNMYNTLILKKKLDKK